MTEVIRPGVDGVSFLRRAKERGYSMQTPFIDPAICAKASLELRAQNLLRPRVELISSAMLMANQMPTVALLHETLNDMVSEVEGKEKRYLPYFSVRVFQPGRYGTTVHRNDPCIGPWAIGVTVAGEADFNVYGGEQLEEGEVIELFGVDSDPKPINTMQTTTGSGWTLYTRDVQTPHSSGVVNSDVSRELILFYNTGNGY